MGLITIISKKKNLKVLIGTKIIAFLKSAQTPVQYIYIFVICEYNDVCRRIFKTILTKLIRSFNFIIKITVKYQGKFYFIQIF